MKSSHIALVVAILAIVGIGIMYVSGGSQAPSTEAVNVESEFVSEMRDVASTISTADAVTEGTVPGLSGNPDMIPRIRVPEEVLIDGIPPDEETIHPIEVFNDGLADLIIEDITTECGCTVGIMEETVIPGKQSGTMNIHIKPQYINGVTTMKRLSVMSNDPRNRRVDIPVYSEIDGEFDYWPRELDVGTIPFGEGREMSFRLWQNGDEKIEITGFRFEGQGHEAIEVSHELLPESEWRKPGNPEYEVKVVVPKDNPEGAIWTALMVGLTCDRVPELKVAVVGLVELFYKLEGPRTTDIGLVNAGDKIKVMDVSSPRSYEVHWIDAAGHDGIRLVYEEVEGENRGAFYIEIDEDVPSGNYRPITVFQIIDPTIDRQYEKHYTSYPLRVR